MITPEHLGLYIHLPWCVSKCPYCDFNSHAVKTGLPEQEYVDALLADMRGEAGRAAGRPIATVFFGGGTPSLFSAAAIGRILDAARSSFAIADDAEITLEANPASADAARFRQYAQAGVNRLSLGVQSLNNRHLKALGRVHRANEAVAAYRAARQANFDNINIDLMRGLPGQSPAEANADLRAAINMRPEHISWYELTLEPNTAFARNPPALPTPDHAFAMQQSGEALLAAADFEQYEVSAWAAASSSDDHPSRPSRHNLNYWRFGDYIGIGAGAHSKLTRHGRILRATRPRHPKEYMRRAAADTPTADTRPVPPQDVLFEYLLNRLRLREGFALSETRRRADIPPAEFKQRARRAIKRGLLVINDGVCATTTRGYRHLNEILLDFLPPKARQRP